MNSSNDPLSLLIVMNAIAVDTAQDIQLAANGTLEDWSSLVRLASRPTNEPIDRAIQAWRRGQLFPTLEGEAIGWYKARFTVAKGFLLSLAERGEALPWASGTVAESDELEIRVKWLLREWWYEKGIVLHAEYLIGLHEIFGPQAAQRKSETRRLR